MTWLDIGNGWRNIYLLSVMVQCVANGLFCALHGFPLKKQRFASLLVGIASTPLLQYLWMLFVALVWPHSPRLFIIGLPPAMAAIAILVMLLRRIHSIPLWLQKAKEILSKKHLPNRAAVVSICLACAMMVLLLPSCIRMMSSMYTISGGDSGEYMGLALRWCENRDFSQLLEKEDPIGHYRGHSHFPSLELYMSYGLMHTGGEMGYPNDKAAFTSIGLLLFFVFISYAGLLWLACGKKKIWIALGLLCFNLVPSLYYSALGAPRDIWRILAVLLAVAFLCGFTEKGNWRTYLLKCFVMCFICFTVMSAHVVCFIILPLLVVAWVLWRLLASAVSKEENYGKHILRTLGLAVSGAVGTIIAFLGNIVCFVRWGNLSPFRLMDTFTTAPWYDLYMEKEFKLKETTTTINFLQNKDNVLMSHATNLGVWGFRLAVIVLIFGIFWLLLRKKDMYRHERFEPAVTASVLKCLCASLMLLLTLLPVTGLLDTKLYSFSGSFLKMARYTLQWYMLCGIMICAFCACISEIWPILCRKLALSCPQNKHVVQSILWLRRVPSFFCAVLCCMAFVDGTAQKGYSESFYRQSRNTMEDAFILLDNSFQSRYSFAMDVMEEVQDDEKLLITRVGYQYPFRSKAYFLAANSIVPILNLPENEIEQTLIDMNVVAIASEPSFWDTRYFHLSTLNDWLNKLPPERIVETDRMRIYFVSETLYNRCASIISNLEISQNESE